MQKKERYRDELLKQIEENQNKRNLMAEQKRLRDRDEYSALERQNKSVDSKKLTRKGTTVEMGKSLSQERSITNSKNVRLSKMTNNVWDDNPRLST